jgi:hypothetical protein
VILGTEMYIMRACAALHHPRRVALKLFGLLCMNKHFFQL